jgi:cytochrome c peroxidase
MPPHLRTSTSIRPTRQTPVVWSAMALLAAGLTGACSNGHAAETIVLAERPPVVGRPSIASATSTEDLSPRVLRRFSALKPAHRTQPAALVDLGRMLYYEPRLSRTGVVSCNSCHQLDDYGATHTARSTGVNGQLGKRNAPSTFHASGHFTQFWDGRASTIEDQVKGPIANQDEMGMTPDDVVRVLAAIPGYVTAFTAAFPADAAPVTFDHVSAAIGAFERGLVTPSRWDRYLAGDSSALTATEKEGAKTFANIGCLVCHTGPYIGGSMFEKVGARVPWPAQPDRGRRDLTGNPADDMMFKVPSLRNVARTAPYFHDGSAQTLGEAVRLMARHQLGIELAGDELRDLEAWLGALTGDIPKAYIAKPTLPPGRHP